MRRVTVSLPLASYPVLIGSDAGAEFAAHLRGPVVTVFDPGIPDGAVFELLRELRGEEALHNLVSVEGGEAAKTLSSLGRLLGRIERLGIDRGGTVLAIGGGTIGDLAGFAAAVWLRGVRYLNVPTTLLSMVDSSVGGKTGVNTERSKNAVGAFWQPAAVLVDPRFLATLPEDQVASAYGEIVKYAVTLDPELIPSIESGLPDVEEVIERCVRAKASVVGGDERDIGARAILNYGHTVGHALEEASGYTLAHGRAVAVGDARRGSDLAAPRALRRRVCRPPGQPAGGARPPGAHSSGNHGRGCPRSASPRQEVPQRGDRVGSAKASRPGGDRPPGGTGNRRRGGG